MKNRKGIINTHVQHRTNGRGYTLCGIKIITFMDIMNEDGLRIPATQNCHQFTPYKCVLPECEKCSLTHSNNKSVK